MKCILNEPPRAFRVGFQKEILIQDCAHIELAPDEQVTFITETGAEYDVVRKDWGFYATPSINGRLERFNLHTVLVHNRIQQYFLLLVEKGCEALFQEYVASEQLTLVCWLDDAAARQRLQQVMTMPGSQ